MKDKLAAKPVEELKTACMKNHMADCKQSSYATIRDSCLLPGGCDLL